MTGDARKPDAVFRPDGRRVDAVGSWTKELALALPNIAKLLGRLATDDRVPAGSKRLAAVVAAYLVSPIDLFPDFVPVIGKTDDIFIAAYALNHLVQRAGEPVVREHWDGASELLDVLLDLVGVVSGLIPRPIWFGLRRLSALRFFGG